MALTVLVSTLARKVRQAVLIAYVADHRPGSSVPLLIFGVVRQAFIR